MFELGIDGRLSILCHQRRLGPDEILAIIGKDGGFKLGLCLSRGPGAGAWGHQGDEREGSG
jgi:hypothetical protein